MAFWHCVVFPVCLKMLRAWHSDWQRMISTMDRIDRGNCDGTASLPGYGFRCSLVYSSWGFDLKNVHSSSEHNEASCSCVSLRTLLLDVPPVSTLPGLEAGLILVDLMPWHAVLACAPFLVEHIHNGSPHYTRSTGLQYPKEIARS